MTQQSSRLHEVMTCSSVRRETLLVMTNYGKVDTLQWTGCYAPLRAHGPQWQPFWLLAESCFHWGFIRREQVGDNGVKGAVGKTQTSNGEKSIRVEALGRKGGTKAQPDIAGMHDWCVCACSWLMTTRMSWDWLTGNNWEERMITGCTDYTVKLIWFDLLLLRSLSRKYRYEPRPNYSWFLSGQFQCRPTEMKGCIYLKATQKHSVQRSFFLIGHRLKDNQPVWQLINWSGEPDAFSNSKVVR